MPPGYDGLPVDVVAAAVVTAGNLEHEGCRTFNINNYHRGDGCHLDAFVNWIESAGYPLTRIDNYGEWFSRLEAKLKSLPEQQRQNSALEILGAYAAPVARTASLVPDSGNFRELVACSSLGAELPHLDEAFIHKCLEDIAGKYAIRGGTEAQWARVARKIVTDKLRSYVVVYRELNLGRHLVRAEHYRHLMVSAFAEWRGAVT